MIPWVWLLLLASTPLHADTFEGTLTKVIDGDSVEVKDARGRTHVFRLLGSDAPQPGQDGHKESEDDLRQHAEGKSVIVDWVRAQLCPPTGGSCEQLAKVLLRGEDLALRQIRRGLSWHDKRQLREQSTTDKTLYADAELQARLRAQGLWKSKNAVPPWEFKPSAAPRKQPLTKSKKRKRKD